MIDQGEKNNILIKTIGWVAFNMLALVPIGFLIYFIPEPKTLHSVVNNELIYQVIYTVATIFLFGGGVLIASCQWIFLRRLLLEITGGGRIWVISGLVSSVGGFVTGFMWFPLLGLGDYPTQIDSLFFVFFVVCGQMISLSIFQGLFLRANQYKKVGQWVILNIFGYSLTVVFSYSLIYRWTDNFAALIVLPTFCIMFATWFSGWGLIHVLESPKDNKVDNPVQESSPKNNQVHYFRANLENQDLHGQNFDGVDFREANLRMAILDDISGEPVKATKMGSGWLSLLTSSTVGVEPFFVDAMKPSDFSKADLTGANLKRAKLRGAVFRNAILRNANLSNAILVNANLREADLSHANLSYADMTDSIFYKTNLEGADLTGAKLDGADFDGANLQNAILRNLDLQGVEYLDRANLTGADLSGAIMPEKD
jgi:uncharacterized protein YjbI with pentapeptide repeats